MGNKSRIRYRIAPGFEMLEQWVENLPALFPLGGVSVFKDRNEVKVFEKAGFSLNVKAFKLPNRFNKYVYVSLRASKAARSFGNALHLLASGASTPAPVAYVECLSKGILCESFYVSLNFPHDFTLREVLTNVVPDKKEILVQWVSFTLHHMHRQGIYHLDYSPGNILIQKQASGYQFAVVDLNRMKFLPVDFETGIRNFRQLHADEESIHIISTEYARLCGESPAKAIELLQKFDQRNKAFRKRKDDFKKWIRGN